MFVLQDELFYKGSQDRPTVLQTDNMSRVIHQIPECQQNSTHPFTGEVPSTQPSTNPFVQYTPTYTLKPSPVHPTNPFLKTEYTDHIPVFQNVNTPHLDDEAPDEAPDTAHASNNASRDQQMPSAEKFRTIKSTTDSFHMADYDSSLADTLQVEDAANNSTLQQVREEPGRKGIITNGTEQADIPTREYADSNLPSLDTKQPSYPLESQASCTPETNSSAASASIHDRTNNLSSGEYGTGARPKLSSVPLRAVRQSNDNHLLSPPQSFAIGQGNASGQIDTNIATPVQMPVDSVQTASSTSSLDAPSHEEQLHEDWAAATTSPQMTTETTPRFESPTGQSPQHNLFSPPVPLTNRPPRQDETKGQVDPLIVGPVQMPAVLMPRDELSHGGPSTSTDLASGGLAIPKLSVMPSMPKTAPQVINYHHHQVVAKNYYAETCSQLPVVNMPELKVKYEKCQRIGEYLDYREK